MEGLGVESGRGLSSFFLGGYIYTFFCCSSCFFYLLFLWVGERVRRDALQRGLLCVILCIAAYERTSVAYV